MKNRIIKPIAVGILIIIIAISGQMAFDLIFKNIKKSNLEPKKLYFEIKKDKPKEEVNGLIKCDGKWCPIILNDSTAIIYQK